ncbi:MAG: hypothetical protein Q7W30_05130 [Coriobacteriia bacterium]|nr:hypothetical protein [Coriobacteriia bacterium]
MRSTRALLILFVCIVLVVPAMTGCSLLAPKTEPAAPAAPAATPPAATADAPFTVGQSVAAVWSDGSYYLANVQKVEGDQVTVKYVDDSSTKVVPATDVVAIEKGKVWATGSDVLAVWSSGRFYQGLITEAEDGGNYTVKWKDGSAPSKVTADKIISIP